MSKTSLMQFLRVVLETSTQTQDNLRPNVLPLILASLELSNLQRATLNDAQPHLMLRALTKVSMAVFWALLQTNGSCHAPH